MNEVNVGSPRVAADARSWVYNIQSRMLTNDWREIKQLWPQFVA